MPSLQRSSSASWVSYSGIRAEAFTPMRSLPWLNRARVPFSGSWRDSRGRDCSTVTRVGNQKHFQANASAPVYEELRGIVMKTSGLADVLRTALTSLAREITAAFVFGSVAKGQDTATSDVDLLVISERLTYADLYSALEGAGTRLGRKVNPNRLCAERPSRSSSKRKRLRKAGSGTAQALGDRRG